MKIAIIGSGNAASFHANAFNSLGVKIEGVLSSPNSSSVLPFSKENKVNNIYKELKDLQDSLTALDGLIIASDTISVPNYIYSLAPSGIPILCEKPVSYDLIILKELCKFKNVKVAFNRRFYPTVLSFKDTLKSDRGISIKVNIPEASPDIELSISNKIPFLVYENSVHIFDLLNFFSDDIVWNYAQNQKKEDGTLISISAMGKAGNDTSLLLDMSFGAPENFKISAFSGSQKDELLPIETLSTYKGMDVTEPNDENPIRSYRPRLLRSSSIEINDNLKPGILEQARSFIEFIEGKEDKRLASIQDSIMAMQSIQEIENLL